VHGEAAHQRIDAYAAVVCGVAGEMGIAAGGQNAVMTQDLLHLQQIDALLDQVGGVAVPQAVGRDVFFRPQSVAT